MFLACVQRYSLESGKVGEAIGEPIVISNHRSKGAAERKTGSLISGKLANAYRYKGEGRAVFVFDTETGERTSRTGRPVTLA